MKTCNFCGKFLKDKDRTHEKYCVNNPNRKSREGEKNPMFGKKGSNHYLNGAICSDETRLKLSQINKGKILTDVHKQNLSISRINFLEENPDKVPYRLNHSSKMSYPEKIFMNELNSQGIFGWQYNFRNGIYSYDFAFLDKKIDVEIDGSTHLSEKVKKIDERRDQFSKENGWTVIRFTAKEVKENVKDCVDKVKQKI